ncbi:MAG: hypothetical protein JNN15_08500 [Blastocatellia bacterium]|nr:hypothetical protein [Blastocatellia bacterium]
MTWIKTIALDQFDETLKSAMEQARSFYPEEYQTPVFPSTDGSGSIMSTHTLIPDALYHAFATFGVLMSPDLPLSRAQHEMVATMVSTINHCYY